MSGSDLSKSRERMSFYCNHLKVRESNVFGSNFERWTNEVPSPGGLQGRLPTRFQKIVFKGGFKALVGLLGGFGLFLESLPPLENHNLFFPNQLEKSLLTSIYIT